MSRQSYPRDSQSLQRRLKRKASDAPHSHGDLRHWRVTEGAVARDRCDKFELHCERHEERFLGSCHTLMAGKSLMGGCQRCRSSWLKKRGRNAKCTYADEIEKELSRKGSNFRLADSSRRRVRVDDYLAIRCLACEKKGLNGPSKLFKLSNLLTHVRSLPGQVACDGGCGTALKGRWKRVGYRESAMKCPSGWSIIQSSYTKFTGDAKVKHKCGGRFICTPQYLLDNPNCPVCSKSLPSNSFRPADRATLERWVRARSSGHLSTQGLYTDSEAVAVNWRKDAINCLCPRHSAGGVRPRNPKHIGKTLSEGCELCLRDLIRRSRAFDGRELRDLAKGRKAQVTKYQGYEGSELLRFDQSYAPLDLVKAFPMTRFGPMSEEQFRGKWASEALAACKKRPAWKRATSRNRLKMLAGLVPAPVARDALGMSDKEVANLRVRPRDGGRIQFAASIGRPKSVWFHHAFDKPERCLKANYWAGFLAADGWIVERNGAAAVSLHIRDEDHLRRLMQFVGSNGKLTYRLIAPTQRRVGGERPAVGLYANLMITSQPISTALREHWGITGRKVRRPFTHLPTNLSAQAAFLVGVIDGDGSATSSGGIAIATVSQTAAKRLMAVAVNVAQLVGVQDPHVSLTRPAKSEKPCNVLIGKHLADGLRDFAKKRKLPFMPRKWG